MNGSRPLEPDGLYTPEVGRHSLKKIQRHNFYAAIFSKAMSKKWRHRVYIGLYAGAGRATVRGTGELVETSAMAVVRQEVPFTKYIFVDSDPRCIAALEARIGALGGDFGFELIPEDVNAAVDRVIAAIPEFHPARSEGLIGLCFVDPFRVDLDFDVIRRLSRYKLDFLAMLPLGFDLRRNLRRYLEDEEDTRVGALIDDPDWRTDWRSRNRSDRHFVKFVLEKFDDAMNGLGFRPRKWHETVSVKVTGLGVFLYALALYTRHPLAEKFWRTAVAGTESQGELDLWSADTAS